MLNADSWYLYYPYQSVSPQELYAYEPISTPMLHAGNEEAINEMASALDKMNSVPTINPLELSSHVFEWLVTTVARTVKPKKRNQSRTTKPRPPSIGGARKTSQTNSRDYQTNETQASGRMTSTRGRKVAGEYSSLVSDGPIRSRKGNSTAPQDNYCEVDTIDGSSASIIDGDDSDWPEM